MQRNDFQFNLPTDLIAQFPAKERTDSRLLALNGNSGQTTDYCFADLLTLLQANDLLVFNNTKVMLARLLGKKVSGGKVEVLVERILDDHHVLAHIRSNKVPAARARLLLESSLDVEVTAREKGLFKLYFHGSMTVTAALEQYGRLPLPPYIERDPLPADRVRYQTVYAEHVGAVAAPTAGLHFDKILLERIEKLGVAIAHITLHVGAGTFQPVRVNDISQHTMHSERTYVSAAVCDKVKMARARGGRVIAVGTTSVRALESASRCGGITPFAGETDMFIYPGYKFNSVDVMITNFHLPVSTLLMLVAAFAGKDNVMTAYQHAIDCQYRFFSYGDAMFVTRRTV